MLLDWLGRRGATRGLRMLLRGRLCSIAFVLVLVLRRRTISATLVLVIVLCHYSGGVLLLLI